MSKKESHVESGKFTKRLDWNYAQVLRQLGLTQDAIAVLRKAAAGDVPDDFKASAALTIDAWAGFLTGSGVPLEVHSGGFLKRPVLLALADGDGGVIVNAGTQLPREGSFPWRANSSEVTIALQQGETGGGAEPHALGAYVVRGVQAAATNTSSIECHVTAMPDGALHFRATQNGRKLPVGWTPPRQRVA